LRSLFFVQSDLSDFLDIFGFYNYFFLGSFNGSFGALNFLTLLVAISAFG
jgi:hypothetical protein